MAQHYHTNPIGKLQQRYNVIQAERNAARSGRPVRRATDKATGQISLMVTF
jgi:hypothetical protein